MVRMVIGEVQTQTAEIKAFCQTYNSALESVSKATGGILLAVGLTGEGMSSIKAYLSSAYPAVCRAAILYSEATVTANQKYIESYTSQFGGINLDSEELEEKIRAADTLLAKVQSTKESFVTAKRNLPVEGTAALGLLYQALIQVVDAAIKRNEEKKAQLEKMLEEFLAFCGESTSYFTEVVNSESLLNRGLQALGQNADGSIGNGTWNGVGFSPYNTDWIKTVNRNWTKQHPVVYGVDEYGGNQSSAILKFKAGDSEIEKILKRHYPDMTWKEMRDFLLKAKNEGCGYIALVNSFLDSYKGTEAEFEAEFGFPLYTIVNGAKVYNFDYLFVDLYAATDNHNRFLWMDTINEKEDESKIKGNGTSQADRDYRYSLYLKEHGLEVDFKNDISPTIANYDKYHNQGELILSVNPLIFEDEAGNEIYNENGGHAVSITGKTEDGRLIISSWGEIYYVNPNDYKNAGNFNMQVVIHK